MTFNLDCRVKFNVRNVYWNKVTGLSGHVKYRDVVYYKLRLPMMGYEFHSGVLAIESIADANDRSSIPIVTFINCFRE